MSDNKSVWDWVEIYIHTIEQTIISRVGDISGVHAESFHVVKSRLRQIAAELQAAGLNLQDDIDPVGVTILNDGQLVWDNPHNPKVTYLWPDGSKVEFRGDEAVSSVMFFAFWMQQSEIPSQTESNKSRIILPGSDEHARYMAAKAADVRKGLEG